LSESMLNHTHKKIVFHDAPWKPFFFVDLYRFGKETAGHRPLVYYIGAAGDAKKYEERVKTQPELLRDQFIKATQTTDHEGIDLIITPAPLTTPEQRETRLDDFLLFFLTALIPRSIGELPNAVGLVGNAYGSFFATYLAFRLEQCRALGLISGMGMIEAYEKSRSTRKQNPVITCYSNIDDEIRSWTDEFAELPKENGNDVSVVRRPGEKRFADYLSNGSVWDAFDFVLKNVEKGYLYL